MPKLTKAAIDGLTPTTRDAYTWDSTLPGFGVRAQPSGRKTYVARYRTKLGRQRKATIGRCCDLSPDQARDLARQMFAAVAAGRDPAGELAADRAAPTMSDLHNRYWAVHAPYKKASSLKHDKTNWARILAALGSTRRVQDITRADAQALHASLAEKPVTANHVRALLSKSMTLAVSWGWITGNPVASTPRFKIRARETILSIDQLGAMHRALADFPRPFADLIRLLSLTGCRLSEIMTARRAWADLGRMVLVLPDTKTGPRVVALSPQAAAIIAAIPEDQEWLIPGKIKGTHMRTPWIAWERLKTSAGLPPGARLHDLRHTAGSLGHAAGMSQRQIADMLGHKDLATTARYLHGIAGDRARVAAAVSAAVAAGWGENEVTQDAQK